MDEFDFIVDFENVDLSRFDAEETAGFGFFGAFPDLDGNYPEEHSLDNMERARDMNKTLRKLR